MNVELTSIKEPLEKNIKDLDSLFMKIMEDEFKKLEKDVENLENVIKCSNME